MYPHWSSGRLNGHVGVDGGRVSMGPIYFLLRNTTEPCSVRTEKVRWSFTSRMVPHRDLSVSTWERMVMQDTEVKGESLLEY